MPFSESPFSEVPLYLLLCQRNYHTHLQDIRRIAANDVEYFIFEDMMHQV